MSQDIELYVVNILSLFHKEPKRNILEFEMSLDNSSENTFK